MPYSGASHNVELMFNLRRSGSGPGPALRQPEPAPRRRPGWDCPATRAARCLGLWPTAPLAVVSLPTWASAMRAWAPEPRAATRRCLWRWSHDGSGGSSLRAVASVPGVLVLQILGDELQAVLADGYLAGLVGVDGMGDSSPQSGRFPGP